MTTTPAARTYPATLAATLNPMRGERVTVYGQSGAMSGTRKRLALPVRLEITGIDTLIKGEIELTGYVLLASGKYPASGNAPMRTVIVGVGTMGQQWDMFGDDASTFAHIVDRVRMALSDDIAYERGTCADCGVNPYAAASVQERDGIPAIVCHKCPVGVNFTTAYPVGTEVMITGGFASGSVATIERVTDAYPTDNRTMNDHYAGRSYVVTLPYHGCRPFPEEYVRPTNPAYAVTYAVTRADAPAATQEVGQMDMIEFSRDAATGQTQTAPVSTPEPTPAQSTRPDALYAMQATPEKIAADAFAAFTAGNFRDALQLAGLGADRHPDARTAGITWSQMAATIRKAMPADVAPVAPVVVADADGTPIKHRDAVRSVTSDAAGIVTSVSPESVGIMWAGEHTHETACLPGEVRVMTDHRGGSPLTPTGTLVRDLWDMIRETKEGTSRDMLRAGVDKVNSGEFDDGLTLVHAASEMAPWYAPNGKTWAEITDAMTGLIKIRTDRIARSESASVVDVAPVTPPPNDETDGLISARDAFGCNWGNVPDYGHLPGCPTAALDASGAPQPAPHTREVATRHARAMVAALAGVSPVALATASAVMDEMGDSESCTLLVKVLAHQESVAARKATQAKRRADARRAYDEAVNGRYELAETATRGHMLNDEGKARGIDARSLFEGPAARVALFASPELAEWFGEHGRMTVGDYQAAMRQPRPVSVTVQTPDAADVGPVADREHARSYPLPRAMRGPQLRPLRQALARYATGVRFTVTGGTVATVSVDYGADLVDWERVSVIVADVLAGMPATGVKVAR